MIRHLVGTASGITAIFPPTSHCQPRPPFSVPVAGLCLLLGSDSWPHPCLQDVISFPPISLTLLPPFVCQNDLDTGQHTSAPCREQQSNSDGMKRSYISPVAGKELTVISRGLASGTLLCPVWWTQSKSASWNFILFFCFLKKCNPSVTMFERQDMLFSREAERYSSMLQNSYKNISSTF